MTPSYLCVLAMSLVSLPMRAQMRTFSDNFSPGGASQMSRDGSSLHGQVIAEGIDVSSSFVVRLSDCDKAGPGRIGSIDSDGGFKFEGVDSGCHNLSVLTMVNREAVYNNMVTVDRAMPDVTIDLQTKPPQRPASGFVSMRQLTNPPPRRARSAWEKGARATQKEHFEEALTHYRRAIELFPDYADAHQGLALALEGLERPAEASNEWETARRLGIESPELYSGLALCLYQLNRKDEADQTARQALAKDPSFAPAHFLLACSLMSRGKCTARRR